MSTRLKNNLITALMVAIILVLILTVTGCLTKYQVVVCSEEEDTCSSVKVWSFREFNNPQVTYGRNEDGVTFTFGADTATTAISPLEKAFADGVRAGARAITVQTEDTD